VSQVRITDTVGNTGLFTNPVTIDAYIPPSPKTAFGLTPDYNNGQAGFDAHVKLFPKSGISRVYGQDCAQFSSANVRTLVARGDRLWFSFKNQNLPALIANWNDMEEEEDYTFFHEKNRPIGGPVLKEYVAFMTTVFKARDTHHNRDLIKLGPNFSWYPAMHGNEGTPWMSFMEIPGYKWDFISWDQYNPQSNKITSPAEMLALPVASGKTYGLKVQIGEWGIQPGSYTEADAADWVTGYGAECNKQGITRAAYWCSHAGTNPSYHVESRPPVLAAVQKLLQG
jgi:hypothetical protein